VLVAFLETGLVPSPEVVSGKRVFAVAATIIVTNCLIAQEALLPSLHTLMSRSEETPQVSVGTPVDEAFSTGDELHEALRILDNEKYLLNVRVRRTLVIIHHTNLCSRTIGKGK
jgi:hypothetical protein